MKRSESKVSAKNFMHIDATEGTTEIKPYYRVHPGGSGTDVNASDQPIEDAFSHADALLRHERQTYTQPMLSLVVPTYNAQQWISNLLETLLALQAEKEILVVDDRSTDATLSMVHSFRKMHPEITLLQHDAHRGHSASLHTGLAASFGKVVVVLDGITAVETKDVVMLVKPILAGCCDVVYGSHHILSPPDQETRWMRLMNRFLTGILNLSTGQHLSHTGSPLKAFRRTALDAISSSTSRRTSDIEMIFQLYEQGRRIYEMTIDSSVANQSAGQFLRRQIATALELLRHGLRF